MSDSEQVSGSAAAPAPESPTPARSSTRWLWRRFGRWSFIALPLLMLSAFVVDELLASGMPRGTRVLEQDVSRLQPKRAEQLLTERARARLASPITLTSGTCKASLVPARAGLSIDVSATLARALHERRGRGVLPRFASWLASFVAAPQSSEPVVRSEQAELAAELSRIEQACLQPAFAGGFHLEQGRITPDYPRDGSRIARARAQSELASALARGARELPLPSEPEPANVPRATLDELVSRARVWASAAVTLSDANSARTLTLSAEELLNALQVAAGGAGISLAFDGDRLLEKLGERRSALENPPKSARFRVTRDDHVEIEPSEPERRLAPESLADAVARAAASAERRAPLPLETGAQPALTTEQAQALGIRNRVSSFTTRHPCCERRVENIHRIADLLDGLVVKPGETLSVNAVIGPRTSKNGFVPAPTIEEGEMVETIGGGISQFATTFFNALFHGGYDIIERQPHTYWFPRYPMGHEATLSFPHPDLVFRNDTDAGMLIHTSYTDKSITVSIYGDNGGRRVSAEVSPRQNIVKPALEILPNPSISPDKEHVLQGGMIGWTVTVGRIIQFADGTKKEERRKVTYKPKARRVEVHPCRVPEGEKGYTGERCPEPKDSGEEAEQAAP